MRRRVLLAAVVLAPLAGCGKSRAGLASQSRTNLTDTSSDQGHLWVGPDGPLARGFCLTMVSGLSPEAAVKAIGGTISEQVTWPQVVGPGDGEENAARYFLGVSGFGRWTMLLEDGPGSLGMTEAIAEPLSKGRTVVAYRGNAAGRGTRRLYERGRLKTEVADHTETAITFIEKKTRLKLSGAILAKKDFLLVTVPKV
ncbi:hypothetical protein Acy02nite_45360 [Actinoplanes cyaneus]|uniref:Lipoprotein n=1 Tax=Actinoplanes cyaneus TaxID=52696 RepID=A0A919IRB8_9ACTN|nr:DUF6461 domain-containing protein [Actinoplanes cyaneus]MCW2139002.1 hypothetical protein [Actinoplanes cyaneus]GID66655.1 hypothetical protein Acy02nite_45360 [Actinoplanes cyaneus]